MTIKNQVLQMVAESGASVEYGNIGISDCFEILIDAPEGQHWVCDGIHQLVQSRWGNEPINDLWQDALERMQYGLEPCDNECDDQIVALEVGRFMVDVAKMEEARPAN